jgi:creatinine amidohydrolase
MEDTRVMDNADIRRWEDMTGAEFAELDPRQTVVLVSCSPIEVHGPHLPVKTDFFEAEALFDGVLTRLAAAHPETTFLRLPPIFAAPDAVSRRGSIGFRTSTTIAVLSDVGRSLARQGFDRVWVGNFHGSPRHILAIETACHQVNRRFGAKMVPFYSMIIQRLDQAGLTLPVLFGDIEGIDRKALEGDDHAGLMETSLMLHLAGALVDRGYAGLEDLQIVGRGPEETSEESFGDLLKRVLALLEHFRTESYAGAPGKASAAHGEAMMEILTDHAAEAAGELLRGELLPSKCHSPLWPFRHLFLSPIVGQLIDRAFRPRHPIF